MTVTDVAVRAAESGILVQISAVTPRKNSASRALGRMVIARCFIRRFFLPLRMRLPFARREPLSLLFFNRLSSVFGACRVASPAAPYGLKCFSVRCTPFGYTVAYMSSLRRRRRG